VASRTRFTLNSAGIEELLKSEPGIYGLIEAGTAAAAADAREGYGEQRVPSQYVLNGVVITDRPQGNITVAVRRAEAIEGKYGYLSKAVQAAGFEMGRGK
jgi:hypothetical protein